MARQNRNTLRDRKGEEPKRDVANNDRFSRTGREESRNQQERTTLSQISGLDRYRLNDLYERSSI